LLLAFVLYGLLHERYGKETAMRTPLIVSALLLSPLVLLLPKPTQPVALVGLIGAGFTFTLLLHRGSSTDFTDCRRSVAAFFALAAMSILPFVSGFRGIAIPSGPDDFANGFASLVFLSHVLADGGLPLWNNANWMGNPLGGDPMWGVWFPLNLWFSSVVALFADAQSPLSVVDLWYQLFNLYRVTISLIGATGCYLLVRYFRIPRVGALIGTAYLTFDIYIQFYNWTTLCIAPWFILYCGKAIEDYSRRHAILAGALFGIMILGGQIKLAVYVALIALGFSAGWLMSQTRDTTLIKLNIKRHGASVLVAVAMALMVASPLIIGLKGYINAGAWRFMNDGATLAPKVIRAEERMKYIDTSILSFRNGAEFASAVSRQRFDATALFLLALALLSLRERRTKILLAGTWLGLALTALPGNFPLQALFYWIFPGWASFRAHSQTLFPLSIVSAVLIGFGYREFVAKLTSTRIDTSSVSSILSVLLLAIGLKVALDVVAEPLEVEHIRQHILQIALLGIITSLCALALLRRHHPDLDERPRRMGDIARPAGVMLLILVVGAKVFAMHPEHFRPTNYWNEPRNEFEMTRELEEYFRPQIAVARESGAPFRIETRDLPFTTYYSGFLYDWETLDGYGGLTLRSAAEAVWSQPLELNNVRYVIVRRENADRKLKNSGQILREHRGAHIVHSNSLFDVIELDGWSPRFQLLPKGEDNFAPLQGLTVERVARDRATLTVAPGDTRRIVHRTSYYPGWKAEVNGREVPIKSYKGWQVIELPQSARESRVEFYYGSWKEIIGIFLMTAGYILAIACLCIAIRRRADVWPTVGTRITDNEEHVK
jgi:hypothetical protein